MYFATMTGEVSWEDVDDAREVIADVRDPDCELKWYVPLYIAFI